MSTSVSTPVAFDPEVAPVVDRVAGLFAPPEKEDAVPGRATDTPMSSPAEAIGGLPIEYEEQRIPGPVGAPGLEVTIFRPRGAARPIPAVYNIHGGGMVSGHRYLDNDRLVRLVDELGMLAVNVEYRLAPEHPFPAGFDDCYAGLVWTADNAESLGIDRERLVVMGGSAGGGFSAALSLAARDRNGPRLAGQLLLCPMIDDHNDSVSSLQYENLGTWPGATNARAWACVLGDQTGGDGVSPYAAPARAEDLSGLPPAFIEVGAAETFRDEDVAFATRLWHDGVDAELHVWAGGCHGFDVFAPQAEISRAAWQARKSWFKRILGL